MKIHARAFLHRLLTYPLLMPLMLLYSVAGNKELVLDVFYWIRGTPHGYISGKTRVASYNGLKIVFPFNEDPFFDDVWLRNVYQAYSPKKNHVVLDIGAHMGFFSLSLIQKTQRIIAVEPDPVNFRTLSQNAKLNNKFGKIEPYNLALGKKSGDVYLNRDIYGHGRSTIVDSATPFPCRMQTLDEFLPNMNVERLDLIKIDTEGFELDILKGSIETLKKHRPDLIIAAYHTPDQYLLVSNFLKKQDYSVSYYHIPLFLSGGKEIYLYAKALDTPSLRIKHNCFPKNN